MHNIQSPRPDTDETIEQAIIAKGLTAPRLKPTDIEDAIKDEAYFVFPGTMLTVCCLTLRNGYTVTGESACASMENFDEQLGQRIARENAKQKIWALEGYLLKQRLWEERPVHEAGAALSGTAYSHAHYLRIEEQLRGDDS